MSTETFAPSVAARAIGCTTRTCSTLVQASWARPAGSPPDALTTWEVVLLAAAKQYKLGRDDRLRFVLALQGNAMPREPFVLVRLSRTNALVVAKHAVLSTHDVRAEPAVFDPSDLLWLLRTAG